MKSGAGMEPVGVDKLDYVPFMFQPNDTERAMPTKSRSPNRGAFDLFLRTGRVPERKYNHHHDDLRRFAFSDGAAAMSNRANATPQPGRTRAKPVAKPAAPPIALDSLSAAEEAHGGPGTISSGVGDKSGISYGSYQLSTNKRIATDNSGASPVVKAVVYSSTVQEGQSRPI